MNSLRNHSITGLVLVILTAAFAAIACSGTGNVNIERATEFNESYNRTEDGHPDLRLMAMGFLNEYDSGIISVTADIENRSLVFRHLEGVTTADIEIVITIVGTEGDRYLDSYSSTKTIENDIYGHLISANITRYERNFEVPPGSYKIFFSVTDKASGSETIREVYTTVPDPGNEIVSMTTVQLFGIYSDEYEQKFEPVTSYNISTKKDSLRFVVQITNNLPDQSLTIRSNLIRFESDTTAARLASFPNYSSSSLPYRGIDYRNEKSLDETRRILDQAGVVMIEFFHKTPEPGNYRFVVAIDGTDEEVELLRGRDFSVKGENFPRIGSPRELAEPLVYLMREREHEKLMSIEDPEKLKEAIDRFWLENVGSVNRAKQVISLYYERVEEANMQFTGFKEGWKTDRGMIYILFGPPTHINRGLRAQQWIGSDVSRDPRYNFLFMQTRIRSNHFPFDNYILQRHQGYHAYQYQQIQLWLSGRILDVHL